MKYRFEACRWVVMGARAALLAAFLWSTSSVAVAQTPAELATVPRHALETRALKDPDGVLRDLPAELGRATAAKDFKELALLHLARANACRVIADWPCQANAAANAQKAAEAAHLPDLQARGLIIEGSSRIAMQDFSRAAQLLGAAERLLKQYPFPELTADMYLVYSSLSHTVGKHAVAADYAGRGLAALGDRPAMLIRIRLLRNQGRALAQLGDKVQAQGVLKQALVLVEKIQDPKLSAELHLEGARVARLMNDVPSQVAAGQHILALAVQLSNSQLKGLGHEVMGLAALNKGDSVAAERELRIAHASFRDLKLERDERRVLRALIRSVLGRGSGLPRAELEALAARSITLETTLEGDDRTMAADDFEARIKYTQQEFDVQRLEAVAALAKQRETALADTQRLILMVAVLILVLLLVLGGFFVSQRRFTARLQKLVVQLRENESRYRMLAENSRDMVVRMRPDGHRLYVSPSARELLGLDPSEFTEPRWDLVHPDDRERMVKVLRELGEKGGSATVAYRARHTNGEYIWLEVLARLVVNPDDGGSREIVYAARDISARIRVEEALQASESQIRAITDNIPAMIARIDTEQRYTFANAFIGRAFGVEPAAMIGRTIVDIIGDNLYAVIKDHVEAALRGESATFEATAEVGGRQRHHQSNYVPDRDAAGKVQGFFTLTFDITEQKVAEAKLDRLARMDSLSGVANRRYFEERLAAAFARSRRQGTALALLCLDIDHFKSINDNHGHPVGDEVIVAFAKSLQSCVREDDLVARLGGDEFVLLIENPEPESGENIARKLLTIMREPVIVDDRLALNVSASMGVAYSAHAPSTKALMDLADRALYSAKAAGRNTYRVAVEGT